MKRILTFLLILTTVVLFTACDKTDKPDEDGGYNIYFLDGKSSKIVSETYFAMTDTKEEIVEELLAVMRIGPQNVLYKKALPDSVLIKEYYFSEDNRLTINFDTTYNDLKGVSEVLCRAAIVKTLGQIEGVEYIEFNVNGQSLMDSNGVLVGLMTDDDFIDSTEAEMNYQLSLYFANREGNALIETKTNIYYTGAVSIEELIIKQLINGPTEIGMYDTIPRGTILLNITHKDDVCIVDLNEKFLEKLPDVNEEVTIYSIVNSLVELPGINKVQFLINGESRDMYLNKIQFDGYFERKLSLIEGAK